MAVDTHQSYHQAVLSNLVVQLPLSVKGGSRRDICTRLLGFPESSQFPLSPGSLCWAGSPGQEQCSLREAG